jgi:hypothetical protein
MHAPPAIARHGTSNILSDAAEVGDSTHAGANICLRCKQGRMTRVNGAMPFDFIFSLVGLDPTACSDCVARGQNVRASRLVAVFAIGVIAFGCTVAFAARRDAAPRNAPPAAAPQLVIVRAALMAHQLSDGFAVDSNAAGGPANVGLFNIAINPLIALDTTTPAAVSGIDRLSLR